MLNAKYEVVRKKYKLPNFELLDADFHIRGVEPEADILVELRIKAEEKIDYFLHLLNTVLQPDPNTLADMYEYAALNQDQRAHALVLFKQLMVVKRVLSEAEVIGNEKITASAIVLSHKTVSQTKQQVLTILQLFKRCWQVPAEKQELDRYFG